MSYKPGKSRESADALRESTAGSRELETLSAMLDNEAEDLEVRRLLQRLEADPALGAAWERMNLVQSLLHNEDIRVELSPDRGFDRLAAGVSAALHSEPSPGAVASSTAGWSRSLARMAIAASVALAVFIGMQMGIQQTTSPVAPALVSDEQADSPAAPTSAASGTAVAATDPVQPVVRQVDPEARQRLEEYIRSASIVRQEPRQLEQLEESPLYRLVNEIQNSQ